MNAGWLKEYRPSMIFIKATLGLIVLLIMLFVVQPFLSNMLENFERTAMQQTVRQLQTAVNFKIAEYIALDKLQQLPEQLNENPMSWLDLDDLGGYDRYLGEVDSLGFGQLGAKQWVFDRSTGRLVYKVKYTGQLRNEDPVINRIQFRLSLEYSDMNEDGQFDADKDKVTGMVLVSEYPYQWLKGS